MRTTYQFSSSFSLAFRFDVRVDESGSELTEESGVRRSTVATIGLGTRNSASVASVASVGSSESKQNDPSSSLDELHLLKSSI